jgi:hypothetical protein
MPPLPQYDANEHGGDALPEVSLAHLSRQVALWDHGTSCSWRWWHPSDPQSCRDLLGERG